MAEALGRRMALPKLTFRSAGITAEAVDPQTIRYMESRGVDLSAHTSKSVSGLERLEEVQVVVVLSPDAERALPLFPPRALHLAWHLPDPSRTAGDPDQVQAAFRRAESELENQIRDLAMAILGDEKETSHA